MSTTSPTGDFNPFGRELDRYADCMVRAGVDTGAGDVLDIRTPVAHRVLAVALAEAAYRAGAQTVDLYYAEPRAQAARVRYGKKAEDLGALPPWSPARYRGLQQPNAATLATTGESDPGVFDGLPPDRVAAEIQRPMQENKQFVKALLDGGVRWSGCAFPTPHWAAQVYPGADAQRAQRRLARDLLEFCRMGKNDPPGHKGWVAHSRALRRRADKMTKLAPVSLNLRGPGTDLTVGLSPGSVWVGGGRELKHGHVTCPNIPTEEVFTSPKAGAAEGPFRCSMPLSFHGRMFENIAGEFRGGRLVKLSCKGVANRKLLAAFLDSEPNARRLGEVALVDGSSRIGSSGRVYYNTLLDENAACHIAFGSGFGVCREPGNSGGINRAEIHIDVMIGTPDFEVTATLANGKSRALIHDGEWKI
jgi:aminopeptidase